MPVTRSELRKQHKQNHVDATHSLVLRMFQTICDEVTTYNNYGMTKYCIVMRYKPDYWMQQPLIDRVVEMLKAHYTDSHIYTHDGTISIEWTWADNFADNFAGSDSCTPVVDLNCDEQNENIQINITLPRRVTRSSSRK